MEYLKLKHKLVLPTLCSAISFSTLVGSAFAGDPVAGEKVFVRFQACHEITPDKSKIGPSLYDVIGREAGSLSSFPMFSEAMKNSAKVWDEANLSEFLQAPMTVIKGTRMIFTGVPAEQDRINLIAYLKSITPREKSRTQ